LDYPTIYADNIDQSEDRDEEIMPLENTFKDTVSINHVFLEALGEYLCPNKTILIA
jgi:hypothetical protein